MVVEFAASYNWWMGNVEEASVKGKAVENAWRGLAE